MLVDVTAELQAAVGVAQCVPELSLDMHAHLRCRTSLRGWVRRGCTAWAPTVTGSSSKRKAFETWLFDMHTFKVLTVRFAIKRVQRVENLDLWRKCDLCFLVFSHRKDTACAAPS